MRKLSAFIMAAALVGAIEVAAAKSYHHMMATKATITKGTIASTDTIPYKKKKKTDPTSPTPTPTPVKISR